MREALGVDALSQAGDTARPARSRGSLATPAVAVIALVVALVGFVLPAGSALASAPMLDVTCTTPVAYGGEVDCLAASVDSDGNYGAPGTFTFDPGHVLPITWDHPTCTVDHSSCQAAGTLAVVPGGSARTLVYSVQFTADDGSRASTT